MDSPVMSADPFSLAGRTAIITGSGRNIGREMAMLFAAHGANVVVNGHRDGAALDRVVGEIEAAGGRALAVLADVSAPGDVKMMVDKAAQHFGSVDIVVSNVGVRRHAAFLDLSVEDWTGAINQNLNSAFYLAQAALPLMMERRWGRFLVLSGSDAFGPEEPERAHIAVSKLALVGLAKALAQEFGPHGITANSLSPGLLATERDWSKMRGFNAEAFIKTVPLRRMGTASDIAPTALFLCSEAGGFISGQTLHINGGQYMF